MFIFGMILEMNNLNNIENKFENSMNEFSKSDMLFGLMELMSVKAILSYNDIRSVRSWCKKSNVFIIKQGNKSYVNKWEFILSFHHKFIKHLKEKHNNWKSIFVAYLKGSLTDLVESSEENNGQVNSKKYKPKSIKESSFLSKIKKL